MEKIERKIHKEMDIIKHNDKLKKELKAMEE